MSKSSRLWFWVMLSLVAVGALLGCQPGKPPPKGEGSSNDFQKGRKLVKLIKEGMREEEVVGVLGKTYDVQLIAEGYVFDYQNYGVVILFNQKGQVSERQVLVGHRYQTVTD